MTIKRACAWAIYGTGSAIIFLGASVFIIPALVLSSPLWLPALVWGWAKRELDIHDHD